MRVSWVILVDPDFLAGWWFGTFFIFPYIGNNHPNWLIFFRGVAQPPTSWGLNRRLRLVEPRPCAPLAEDRAAGPSAAAAAAEPRAGGGNLLENAGDFGGKCTSQKMSWKIHGCYMRLCAFMEMSMEMSRFSWKCHGTCHGFWMFFDCFDIVWDVFWCCVCMSNTFQSLAFSRICL